jgi:hypothetical protein
MQPRETLYHKTVDMAWQTNMLIGKVSSEREDAKRENDKEHTKLLNEILRCLGSLETITKLLTKVENKKQSKIEWLVVKFHLYLCYVHHMDITPVDGKGAPSHIGKTCTVSQKEENKGQDDEEKKHIIILD